MMALVVRWLRVGGGLVRAMLRLVGLTFVLAMALAHAGIRRWTTSPTAPALARGRTAWLHHWSLVVCAVLGVRVDLDGFVPVSGLVIVDHLSPVDALLLSAVAPFVFVIDLDLRRVPIVGCAARMAGVLFRDRKRPRDVVRMNFTIARALQRRQLVVLSRHSESGCSSALLQSAADTRCTLTATAIRFHGAISGGHSVMQLLRQARSAVTVIFHPPVFHYGNRKQLAEQLGREIQKLAARWTKNQKFIFSTKGSPKRRAMQGTAHQCLKTT